MEDNRRGEEVLTRLVDPKGSEDFPVFRAFPCLGSLAGVALSILFEVPAWGNACMMPEGEVLLQTW